MAFRVLIEPSQCGLTVFSVARLYLFCTRRWLWLMCPSVDAVVAYTRFMYKLLAPGLRQSISCPARPSITLSFAAFRFKRMSAYI